MIDRMKLSMEMKIDGFCVQTPDEKHKLVFDTKAEADTAKTALEHAYALGRKDGEEVTLAQLHSFREILKDHADDCAEVLALFDKARVAPEPAPAAKQAAE